MILLTLTAQGNQRYCHLSFKTIMKNSALWFFPFPPSLLAIETACVETPGLQINLPPGRFNQQYQYIEGLAPQCQNAILQAGSHIPDYHQTSNND